MKLNVKFYGSFFFILLSVNLFSQNNYPGNVSNPHLWLKAKQNNELFTFENITNTANLKLPSTTKGAFFNNNASVFLDGSKDSLIMNLNKAQAEAQTLFIVYKLKDNTNEQFLWNLSNTDKILTVATTDRLANLETYKYKTYSTSVIKQNAAIHFYYHNQSSIKESNYLLAFASKPNNNLPPETFKGLISEIIIYNRVLSSTELQKVASYLAIKYGITLSQLDTKNYLNSSNEIIWEFDKHKEFSNNITGLGKDENSGLLQLKSTNMAEENLLSMQINTAIESIPNNYFVFWSDNAKDLVIKKQEEGFPKGIARKWLLNYEKIPEISLDWKFDVSKIKGIVEPDNFYWLVVDPSGKSNFNNHNLEYTQLASVLNKEPFLLENYNWDIQNNKQIAYTIQVAPAMFALVKIEQPQCGLNLSGNLNFKIQGGKAPYTITLYENKTGELVKKWTQNNLASDLVSINSGSYNYVVTDANRKTYKQSVFITDNNSVIPALQTTYTLLNEEPVYIDLNKVLPAGNYHAQWFFNDQLFSEETSVFLGSAGDYELKLENEDGCKSVSRFIVNGKNITTMQSIIFPNPTEDGNFTVLVSFPKTTNIKVSVFTLTGALISQNYLSNQSNYTLKNNIATSGVYLVKINSDFDEKNYKLIVK